MAAVRGKRGEGATPPLLKFGSPHWPLQFPEHLDDMKCMFGQTIDITNIICFLYRKEGREGGGPLYKLYGPLMALHFFVCIAATAIVMR